MLFVVVEVVVAVGVVAARSTADDVEGDEALHSSFALESDPFMMRHSPELSPHLLALQQIRFVQGKFI